MFTQNPTKHHWINRPLTLALAASLLAIPAFALEVSPKVIEFDTIDTSATVAVTQNGQGVDASAIKSVKLYAGENDYDHMIEVTKTDGHVTVRPSDMLEIGSYNLVIDTAEGTASTQVLAPLDGLYDSLESRAARLNITTNELKARLGLTKRVGTDYVALNLPKVYYVGQTLTIPIERKEDCAYVWRVNGEPIELGLGHDMPLRYTFTEPGIYDITYVEMKDGAVNATGFGATRVVPEPPVRRHYAENAKVKFQAPDGYAHYTWALDGKELFTSEDFVHTFNEPGKHVLTLHAHTPVIGHEEEFREITYIISVS